MKIDTSIMASDLRDVTRLAAHAEQLGFDEDHARKRAHIAFSLYLGQVQMWTTLPALVEPVLDEAVQVLTS